MISRSLLALLLLLPSSAVLASNGQTDSEILTDRELAELRGGFSLEGLELSFGAEVRTYLDGQLVLQTNFNWSRDGIIRSEFVSDVLSQPEPAQLAAGLLAGNGITASLTGQRIFLANNGQTAILHRTDRSIQNILLNTASGLHARQEVDASVNLTNAQSFLGLVRDTRLGDALNSAIVNGVR